MSPHGLASEDVSYRDVPGLSGYRVGDDGSVWSCRRSRRKGAGLGSHSIVTGEWRKRRPTPDRQGYLRLSVRVDDRVKLVAVHRLVLLAFTGPPAAGQVACHFNGCRSDNRPGNLRWDSVLANNRDRYRHGTMPRGESHGRTKLTDDQKAAALAMLESGSTRTEVAKHFGVARSTVWYLMNVSSVMTNQPSPHNEGETS